MALELTDHAAYDDAAAHAGSQGDHHHILMAFSAALPHLAQGRHIGVVARLYQKAGFLIQLK